MRKGFRLEELRAMPVDELEAFLAIFYPPKGRTASCKSLRQITGKCNYLQLALALNWHTNKQI